MSTSTNTSCIRCKHMQRPDNQRYEGFSCTNPIVMARYNEDTGRTTSQMYIDQARPMFCQGRLFEEKVLAGEKTGASAAHAEVPGNMFKKCEVLTETNVGYAASAQGFPKVSVERCEDYPNCPNLCCPPGKCNRNRPIANCSRGLFETWVMETKHPRFGFVGESWLDQGDEPNTYANDYVQGAWVMWQANRPAQTEQRPEAWQYKEKDGNWYPITPGFIADAQRYGHEVRPLYAAPIAQTAPPAAQDVSGLVEALEYYAHGDHLLLADPDSWDTCTGEPVNFLHDAAGTASVEDGSIAKVALSAYKAAQTSAPTAPLTATIPVAQLLDIRHALVNGAQVQRLFLLAELLEKAIESATGKPLAEVQKP